MNQQENKNIIRQVNAGFAAGDEDAILVHVADDIVWHITGFATARGREEFRKHIRNDAFEGNPVITTIHEVAEGEYVAVEGSVQCAVKGGGMLDLRFHNKYHLRNGKILEMRSYVVPVQNDQIPFSHE